jgi:Ca-activated chloride channel family protein
MFFRDYGTNSFVDTRRDRLSTFATDVDDASFNIVKRYLMDGYLPPRDAVRIEEFINHFDYNYATPDHKRFRIFYETTASPFDRRITVLKIGIKGAEVTRRERDPLNLTFVIDVSGSMGYDNRLELVKESLRMLVNQLTHRDRIGIVAYGSQARVVLQPTGIARRNDILRAISSLHPGGSTYAEAGLKLGYSMANSQYVNGHTNRIILCSDGVANVGRVSPDAIMAQVNRYANKGITLSTFGYGMGNYNDVLLERLAQKGNGKYAYVNDLREAQKLFVSDFVGSMQVLARDVKVQVDFNPEIVTSYRLIGYENRDVADNRFRDNRQDGGEVGAGHEVTALYELILHDSRRRADIGTIAVRWTDPDRGEVTEVNQNVTLDRKSLAFRESRPELRLAVVASRFGELLKGTVYASETSFEELYQMAQSLTEELGGEQTHELADLILRARDLSTYHTRR